MGPSGHREPLRLAIVLSPVFCRKLTRHLDSRTASVAIEGESITTSDPVMSLPAVFVVGQDLRKRILLH